MPNNLFLHFSFDKLKDLALDLLNLGHPFLGFFQTTVKGASDFAIKEEKPTEKKRGYPDLHSDC